MDIQIVAGLLLPAVVVIIMFSLGLGLTLDDFKRVAVSPKPVLVGLSVQMLILPLVAFALCYLFHLPPAFSIGLMLVAACPGAPTANLYSKLVGADVALNISLTAINSLLTSITLPIVASLILAHFAGHSQELELPASKTLGIFFVIAIPVLVGILVNRFYPAFAARLDRPLRIFSLVALAVIIIGAAAKEWHTLMTNLPQIGWVVVTFNVLSLLIAFNYAKLFRVPAKGCTAIMFGCAIHTASIPLYVAISLLNSTEIAIPAACYGIFMYFTAAGVCFWFKRPSRLKPTRRLHRGNRSFRLRGSHTDNRSLGDRTF